MRSTNLLQNYYQNLFDMERLAEMVRSNLHNLNNNQGPSMDEINLK